MTQQRKWTELDLIAMFGAKVGATTPAGLVQGIGDDCAVFSPGGRQHWLVTTDMLIEGIHFDRSWHPPRLLGRKSIAVNLSDIAAMGGSPRYALISVALPDEIEGEWVAEWFEGVSGILAEFSCTLIGGDTVRGPVLVINVAMLGSAPSGDTLLRSGARPGQNIYVSGTLGGAAAGLEVCRNPALFASLTEEALAPLIARHLNPMPRVRLGRELARSGLVGAMQDLSDGIATDLAHICLQSGVGAELEAGLLPGREVLDPVCRLLGSQPTRLQIGGGEDYELLFTVHEGQDRKLISLLEREGITDIRRVGRTVAGSGVLLSDGETVVDIAFQGYQHRADAGSARLSRPPETRW